MSDISDHKYEDNMEDQDVVELTREEWLATLEELAEERGYFQPLGDEHAALFTDEGTTLLVTFESIDGIMESGGDGLPMGWALSDTHGWSQLCLLCDGNTWFRDTRVFGYFDRLIDDGFFEDFDRVVFYGAGPCGYAAAAFSVAAPGATVVAIQPQASLDAREAPWDVRFPAARRRFLSSRYAYAPEMVDAAQAAFVLYDPENALDSAHAGLFRRPHVARLALRHMGNQIDTSLAAMGMLEPLLTAAMNGALTRRSFWQMYRPYRRQYLPLMRQYLQHLIERNKNRGIVHLARHVLRTHNAPRFKRAGQSAVRNLERMGINMRLEDKSAPEQQPLETVEAVS